MQSFISISRILFLCFLTHSTFVFAFPRPLTRSQKCVDCHTQRNFWASTKAENHQKLKLDHINGNKCDLCHYKNDISSLRLMTDEKISFPESALLCGQCHGPQKKDWDNYLHGKNKRPWKREKNVVNTRWMCVSCHDPHNPEFPKMKAINAPKRPNLSIKK